MPNTLHAMRPFTARPVILNAPDKQRATFRSATCNYQYIIRAVAGHDVFGATPDFSHRLDELVTSGRAAPRRADTNNLVGQRLWQEADRLALAHRTDQPAAWHCVGSLPSGLQLGDWRTIIDEFLEDHLVRQGMIIDWGIHHREETEELPGIQTAFTGLEGLLRPRAIHALCDAFAAAQLCDTLLATQAFEHDPDFVLNRKIPPRGAANVLHHRLGGLLGGLGSRFWAGGIGSHLRSSRHCDETQSLRYPQPQICAKGADAERATGKSGQYRYYRCNKRTNYGASSCRCPAIRVEKLDQMVTQALADQLFSTERLRLLLQRVLDVSDEARRRQRRERAQCEAEITRSGTGVKKYPPTAPPLRLCRSMLRCLPGN